MEKLLLFYIVIVSYAVFNYVFAMKIDAFLIKYYFLIDYRILNMYTEIFSLILCGVIFTSIILHKIINYRTFNQFLQTTLNYTYEYIS